MLTRVVVRSVPWGQVSPVLALAVAPALVTLARGGRSLGGAVGAWTVVAGGVAGLAFDEPARPVVDATAIPLARRTGVRLLSIALAVGAAGLVAGGSARLADNAALANLGAHLAVLGAVAGLSAGAASVVRRRGADRISLGEVAFGPLMVLLTSVLAQQYDWLPSIDGPRHPGRWWVPAVLGAGLALWNVRDPYRR